MSDLTYAGKTYEFTVDDGTVFRNTYAANGTRLRFQVLAGPATGTTEDVDLHAAEITPGVFLVGWTERSGMTVTHAMDLATNTVHAFWTYPTAHGRVGELHTGTLTQITL